MVSATAGSTFGARTVTAAVCAAESPPGSVAVTVIWVSPASTPVSVMAAPATAAVTRSVSADSAANVSASPSGSVNLEDRSSVMDCPTSSSTAEIALATPGARLTGGGAGGGGWISSPVSCVHANMQESMNNATAPFNFIGASFRVER